MPLTLLIMSCLLKSLFSNVLLLFAVWCFWFLFFPPTSVARHPRLKHQHFLYLSVPVFEEILFYKQGNKYHLFTITIHKYTSLGRVTTQSSNLAFLKLWFVSRHELKIVKMKSIFFVLKSSLHYFNTANSTTVFPDTLIHNIGFILWTSHFNSQIQAGYLSWFRPSR